MAATAVPEHRATARLTIDVEAVVANWHRLAERVRPAACAAVVKADAYGLGAVVLAPALASAGCRTFFVAEIEEGVRLRPLVGHATIGVLGGLLPESEGDVLASHLTPVLNHLGELEVWRAFAARCGRPLPAFVHLDTGMNRLGLGPDEQGMLLGDPGAHLAGIEVHGWLSHLACADEPEHWLSSAQLGRFVVLTCQLPAAPVCLANSAGIFRGRCYHFDLVRPGNALYGGNPLPGQPNPMRPVVGLEARVLQVRSVDSGQTVGYGATHSIRRRGRIATLGLGYSDGYLRSLGGRGTVLIAGHPAPLVGRVSMDLVTVDVTGLPEAAVRVGEWATVMGPHRPVDQVAAEAGTIGYEILTRLGSRFHRRYV